MAEYDAGSDGEFWLFVANTCNVGCISKNGFKDIYHSMLTGDQIADIEGRVYEYGVSLEKELA